MKRFRNMMHAPHICGLEHEFWVDADKYCTPENLVMKPVEHKNVSMLGEWIPRNQERLGILCPLSQTPLFVDFYMNMLNEIDHVAGNNDPVFALIGPSTVVTDEGCNVIRTALVCTSQSLCIVTTINDVSSYHAMMGITKEEMFVLENLLAWFFFDFPKAMICTAASESSGKSVTNKAEAEYHARMYLSKTDLLTLSLINLMAIPNQKPIVHTLYSHESLFNLSKVIMKTKTTYYTPYFFSSMKIQPHLYAPIVPRDEVEISPFDQDAFHWAHVALYAQQHHRFSILSAFSKISKPSDGSLIRIANKINYQGRKVAMERNYKAFWDLTQDMWIFGDDAPCEQCLVNRIKVMYEPFSLGHEVESAKTLVQTDVKIYDMILCRYDRISKKSSQQEVDEIMATMFQDEKKPKPKQQSPKKKAKKPSKVVIYEEEEVPETPQKPVASIFYMDMGTVFIPPTRNYISPWGPIARKA